MELPSPERQKYFLMAKPFQINNVRHDWMDFVADYPGVEVITYSHLGMKVLMTEETKQRLVEELGANFYLEREIPHYIS